MCRPLQAPPAYDNGSPVLSYRLEMSVADGPFTKIYSGPATAHKPPKSALPIGQSVRFRVRASNAIGPGPMSGPSMPFVPLPPLPPPSPSPSADGRRGGGGGSSRASSPTPSLVPSLYKRSPGPGSFGRVPLPGSPRGASPSPLQAGVRNPYGREFGSPGGKLESVVDVPYPSPGAGAGALLEAADSAADVVAVDSATYKRVASKQTWRKFAKRHKIDSLFLPLMLMACLSIFLLRGLIHGQMQ